VNWRLDRLFNSNHGYSVELEGQHQGDDGASAQIQVSDDTWHWPPVTSQRYQRTLKDTWNMVGFDQASTGKPLGEPGSPTAARPYDQ
jgi:hypothetical protein